MEKPNNGTLGIFLTIVVAIGLVSTMFVLNAQAMTRCDKLELTNIKQDDCIKQVSIDIAEIKGELKALNDKMDRILNAKNSR